MVGDSKEILIDLVILIVEATLGGGLCKTALRGSRVSLRRGRRATFRGNGVGDRDD